jgi:hypothetical protein
MRGTEQGRREQTKEGRGPALRHATRALMGGAALEVAEEIDLLPDFEDMLRDSAREEWGVPCPEGLLG